MCGIAGLYRWPEGGRSLSARLDGMCAAMVHRGPDDQGLLVDGEVALGMRRLSIIDVEGGHQPIANETGTVSVILNGEIYNFRELRSALERRGHEFRTRTDTEVLVHAYEEDGPECVKQLNGIFGFAIWDGERRRLLLARDRMGVKPLYYARRGGSGLAFASEIKALLTLPGVDRQVDVEATAQFFRLGYVLPPRTLFHGVYKIPPGCRLLADRRGIDLQRYWDLEFEESDSHLSFQECTEQLRVLLQEVVGSQMVSDVALGAFLSGGVDSSAVVAFMKRTGLGPVKTFSIGFDSRHAYHNEAPYAEAVARDFGTEHRTLVVQPRMTEVLPALVRQLDEPLTDPSFLNTYFVAGLAREQVKVALSGLGGDEVFAGYRRYLAPTLAQAVSWVPTTWRRMLGEGACRLISADRETVQGNLGRYAKALGRTWHLPLGRQYVDLVAALPAERVAALMGSYPLKDDPALDLAVLYDRPVAAEPLDRLLYVDARSVLPESLLLLSDKMGMAQSLEVRVPLLDNRIVDFIRHVPATFRLQALALKRLFKAALTGIVPDFVLTRSKRGFGMPMGDWIRGEMRPMVADLLSETRLRRAGLFDASVVQRLLAEHEQGKEDHTEAIFALITFELWREGYGVGLT